MAGVTLDSLDIFTAIPNTPHYIYQACVDNKHGNYAQPRLIIICTWTDARPKLILKYVELYRSLYPNSSILLVRTATVDFFLTSWSSWRAKLQPAIKLIHSFVKNAGPSPAKDMIMAHVLSNGGSGHLTYIARAYLAELGNPIPLNTVILDSTPTRAGFSALVEALSIALPRNFILYYTLRTIITALVMCFYTVPHALGRKNLADQVCDDLNSVGQTRSDGSLVPELIRKKATRTYILSNTDTLCRAEDIMVHIAEARTLGLEVHDEHWVGSAHCSHLKDDPVRYAEVVTKAWDNRR